MDPIQPAIVLVRPQLGENIGKAARAMLNFGLTELRLVTPRDGWPNPDAGPSASGADIVLDNARVFETTEEAVADLNHVFASTVRGRDITFPVVTPGEAAKQIHETTARGARSGILFGPERSGLENEDVVLADTILTVPVNPEFGSLNLAQAVILIAYEWHNQKDDTPAVQFPDDSGPYEGPATKEELISFLEYLEEELESRSYFFPAIRKDAMTKTLRAIFQNADLTSQEVRALWGVIKGLVRPRER